MNEFYQQNTLYASDLLTCVIIDGEIHKTIFNGSKELIGYTTDKFDEVLEKAEKYQQLLIDNDLLEKEKTQEEINKELTEKLKQQEEINKELLDFIKEFKRGKENDPKPINQENS